MTFGQGFDSPHLHQLTEKRPNLLKARALFCFRVPLHHSSPQLSRIFATRENKMTTQQNIPNLYQIQEMYYFRTRIPFDLRLWFNGQEDFKRSLKTKSLKQARQDIFNYIEMFYNPVRRHGYNKDLSPVEFERRHIINAGSV